MALQYPERKKKRSQDVNLPDEKPNTWPRWKKYWKERKINPTDWESKSGKLSDDDEAKENAAIENDMRKNYRKKGKLDASGQLKKKYGLK